MTVWWPQYVAAVACLLGLCALLWLAWQARRPAALRARQRVVVNLRDGTAVEGALWHAGRHSITVRGAVVHQLGEVQGTPADGDVTVPVDQVLWVQSYGKE